MWSNQMAKQRKPALTKGKAIRDMISAITGRENTDSEYIGKKVFGRKGTKFEKICGSVTNTSLCNLEGCGCTKLHVLWPSGDRTYPCAKGCLERPDGNMEIV